MALPAGGEELPVPAAVEDLLGTRVAALGDEARRAAARGGARARTCTSTSWRRSPAAAPRSTPRSPPACCASTATACAPRTRCSPPRRGPPPCRRSGATSTPRSPTRCASPSSARCTSRSPRRSPTRARRAALDRRRARRAPAARARRRSRWPSRRSASRRPAAPTPAPSGWSRSRPISRSRGSGSGWPSCCCRRSSRCRRRLARARVAPARRLRQSTAARRTPPGSTGRWRRRATIPPCVRACSRSARSATAAEGVERIAEAEAWAVEALPELDASQGARLGARPCAGARSTRSAPCSASTRRGRAARRRAGAARRAAALVAGRDRAGTRGDRALPRAGRRARRGVGYAWLRLNLTELELRAGEWDAAERLLDEWADADDGQLLITPTYKRCRALLAAGRGDAEAAERWGAPALAEAEERDYRWQVLESARALGAAALLAGDLPRAAEYLRRRLGLLRARGRSTSRARSRSRPDLVEALVGARRARRGPRGHGPAGRAAARATRGRS